VLPDPAGAPKENPLGLLAGAAVLLLAAGAPNENPPPEAGAADEPKRPPPVAGGLDEGVVLAAGATADPKLKVGLG